MKTVNSLSQIEKNIEKVEKIRNSSIENEEIYKSLVKRGICFFPYLKNLEISFIPSRFIGYINNDFIRHAKNSFKHGGDTNKAITEILGSPPQEDSILENAYLKFCKTIGIDPNKDGSRGNPRKYWITPEILLFLENKIEDEIIKDNSITNTQKQSLIQSRIGQGKFRKALIKKWGACCSVSKCDYVEILKASHIKPWKNSNNTERLDVYNGLLLQPNYDTLFDKGLISFKNNGKIMISKKLSEDNCKLMQINKNIKINLEFEHLKYLEFHRKMYFNS